MAALLQGPRFAGNLKVDFRTNAIFSHAHIDSPCGSEIKNKGFTGFARGGEKGLWFSAIKSTDTALVIVESGIDALSHAALHPNSTSRYASTGGAMNREQPALIRGAIEKMGQGAEIRGATDNDEGGRTLADQIAAIAKETGRKDLKIVRDLPEGEGGDWNDRLRESQPQASGR